MIQQLSMKRLLKYLILMLVLQLICVPTSHYLFIHETALTQISFLSLKINYTCISFESNLITIYNRRVISNVFILKELQLAKNPIADQ